MYPTELSCCLPRPLAHNRESITPDSSAPNTHPPAARQRAGANIPDSQLATPRLSKMLQLRCTDRLQNVEGALSRCVAWPPRGDGSGIRAAKSSLMAALYCYRLLRRLWAEVHKCRRGTVLVRVSPCWLFSALLFLLPLHRLGRNSSSCSIGCKRSPRGCSAHTARIQDGAPLCTARLREARLSQTRREWHFQHAEDGQPPNGLHC